MKRLKTKIVEKIYSILEKYAEASTQHYDREGFIYSFGVVPNPPHKFELVCIDGSKRTFFRNKEGEYYMTGKGDNRVNAIIRKLLSEEKKNGDIMF